MTKVGINVIGHVGGNLGVGVVTRQVIELLLQRGHPVAAFDVDRDTWQSRDAAYDHLLVDRSADLPHGINLFVLGLGGITRAVTACAPELFDEGRFNAIVCFWELPALPVARTAQLDAFDLVIAASDFMWHVFLQALEHAVVIKATFPIPLPRPVPFERATLGIGESEVVFGFNFDPMSDIERKNPRAVITAFERGAGRTGAWLVVRINNAYGKDGALRPPVVELQEEVAGNRRIVLVTHAMSYPEVIGLYGAFDVYVSLHRAEGLGLGMAEAMTLGVPVIGTGWSGNLTFMRHANACLVDYTLVPVRPSLDAYREGGLVGQARWAEPDVDHATALMSWLATDAEGRRALGVAAADSMRRFDEVAREARFVDDVIAFAARREALQASGYRTPRTTPTRPPLVHAPVPLSHRPADAAAGVARRILHKLAKIARGTAVRRVPREVHPR